MSASLYNETPDTLQRVSWFCDATPSFGVANRPIGSISGTVTRQGGGGIAGATVKAFGDSGEAWSKTNAGGYYTTFAIPPGSYTMRASAAGYDSLTYPIPVIVRSNQNTGNINFVLTPVGVENKFKQENLGSFKLLSLSNPVKGKGEIAFFIRGSSHVSIKVYSVSGRLILTLLERRMESGEHRVSWDTGSISSGIYFLRMDANDRTSVFKITILK